jgi:DNA repair protein RecO (recombination protein O)
MDFDKVDYIPLQKNEKIDLLNQVITYFELHLQQFKQPKSTEILNEIFKNP